MRDRDRYQDALFPIGFCPNWNMNWVQFKDPVYHMCLAGTVVASRSLTQEEAGLNPLDHKYIFITEFSEFTENF